jgi:hypothetical protein
MSYLASNLIFSLKNNVKNKPIENCHMENAILGKDFNIGAIGLLFNVFTHSFYLLILWITTYLILIIY